MGKGEAKSMGGVRAVRLERPARYSARSAELGEQPGPVDFASGKRKGGALGVSLVAVATNRERRLLAAPPCQGGIV